MPRVALLTPLEPDLGPTRTTWASLDPARARKVSNKLSNGRCEMCTTMNGAPAVEGFTSTKSVPSRHLDHGLTLGSLRRGAARSHWSRVAVPSSHLPRTISAAVRFTQRATASGSTSWRLSQAWMPSSPRRQSSRPHKSSPAWSPVPGSRTMGGASSPRAHTATVRSSSRVNLFPPEVAAVCPHESRWNAATGGWDLALTVPGSVSGERDDLGGAVRCGHGGLHGRGGPPSGTPLSVRVTRRSAVVPGSRDCWLTWTVIVNALRAWTDARGNGTPWLEIALPRRSTMPVPRSESPKRLRCRDSHDLTFLPATRPAILRPRTPRPGHVGTAPRAAPGRPPRRSRRRRTRLDRWCRPGR